ncbi:hypothetical protein C7M84_004590 [Penaeus vannamei]|uniref:Uncharacterized protein n=1 Tax=Penaeus vannamei TaxID=6689 RepID=A0A423TK26_PENVA|nr:hypothetical protein C7M84_004590 [Penaeus vannamei]
MRNGREIAPCHDSDPEPVRPATQGRAAPRSTSAWPSPPSGPRFSHKIYFSLPTSYPVPSPRPLDAGPFTYSPPPSPPPLASNPLRFLFPLPLPLTSSSFPLPFTFIPSFPSSLLLIPSSLLLPHSLTSSSFPHFFLIPFHSLTSSLFPLPSLLSSFPLPLTSSSFPLPLTSSSFPLPLTSSSFPPPLTSSSFPLPLTSSSFPLPLTSSSLPQPHLTPKSPKPKPSPLSPSPSLPPFPYRRSVGLESSQPKILSLVHQFLIRRKQGSSGCAYLLFPAPSTGRRRPPIAHKLCSRSRRSRRRRTLPLLCFGANTPIQACMEPSFRVFGFVCMRQRHRMQCIIKKRGKTAKLTQPHKHTHSPPAGNPHSTSTLSPSL